MVLFQSYVFNVILYNKYTQYYSRIPYIRKNYNFIFKNFILKFFIYHSEINKVEYLYFSVDNN